MKKIITFTLALIMVLSLCACGASGKDSVKGLQVGYGRVDITPQYPVSIAGSAADRVSQGFKDPIYFTCIALRYAEETFLVATIDVVGAYQEFANATRSRISQDTGIPEDHIILNTTHTHSSANLRNADQEGIAQYQVEFFTWAAESAKAAIEDLSSAEVWYGSTQTEGMAWVRHYEMVDGSYSGPNFGNSTLGYVGHSTDADGELQIIKFVRPAEDKKDVVLMNFPAHATMQSEYYISADFPGPARDYVAEQTDTLVAYFIAGAGNQTPGSRIPGESFSSDYRTYGQELGRIAVECLNSLTKVEAKDIRFSQRTFTGKPNKEKLDRIGDATAVKAIWDKVGGRGTDAGKAAALEHGFSSVYEVTAILSRPGLGDSRSMIIKTMAMGDVSLIFAPYEMAGENAIYIKENSPYPMTFVVTCSQNHDGYLPSELGWEVESYESMITRWARGTAEQLAKEYVNMLTEMKTAE